MAAAGSSVCAWLVSTSDLARSALGSVTRLSVSVSVLSPGVGSVPLVPSSAIEIVSTICVVPAVTGSSTRTAKVRLPPVPAARVADRQRADRAARRAIRARRPDRRQAGGGVEGRFVRHRFCDDDARGILVADVVVADGVDQQRAWRDDVYAVILGDDQVRPGVDRVHVRGGVVARRRIRTGRCRRRGLRPYWSGAPRPPAAGLSTWTVTVRKRAGQRRQVERRPGHDADGKRAAVAGRLEGRVGRDGVGQQDIGGACCCRRW